MNQPDMTVEVTWLRIYEAKLEEAIGPLVAALESLHGITITSQSSVDERGSSTRDVPIEYFAISFYVNQTSRSWQSLNCIAEVVERLWWNAGGPAAKSKSTDLSVQWLEDELGFSLIGPIGDAPLFIRQLNGDVQSDDSGVC